MRQLPPGCHRLEKRPPLLVISAESISAKKEVDRG